MRLVTPVEVSLCTTTTALTSCAESARNRCSRSVSEAPRRQLHLVQRFSRPDFGHIAYEVIVDDPKTFTRPWKNVRTLTLRADWEMMEYSCEENNKSLWEGRIKVPKYKP